MRVSNRLSRRTARAFGSVVVLAAAASSVATVPAHAAPGDSPAQTAPVTQPVLTAPMAGVSPAPLAAASGQPLPALAISVFSTAPGVAQKAQAAQRAAEKRAAQKKAAAARAERQARAARSAARAGSPRDIARAMVADRGWSADQFSCLDRLWTKESEWKTQATNASSGAYGIPQSLPGTKMASAGADWKTNPATQIRWGLGYIADRYGSPCRAWSHSQAVNWY